MAGDVCPQETLIYECVVYKASRRGGIRNQELASPCCQGEEGDFGGAVEADWGGQDTDASGGIDLRKVANARQAHGVFDAILREDERSQARDANLTAVRMTRELEIDFGLSRHVGEIGFVHEGDFAGVVGDVFERAVGVLSMSGLNAS